MSKGITETDRFIFFWRGWPSQWIKTSFVVDGVTYMTCEQYMMAEKARIFGDPEMRASILGTTNPRMQKAFGRRVRNFDDAVWRSVCRAIVYQGNHARFSQNDADRRLLLATGDRTLVEASPMDRIWGIGLTADDPRALDPAQWRGTNWLGIALTQVRESLASNPSTATDAELVGQLDNLRALG